MRALNSIHRFLGKQTDVGKMIADTAGLEPDTTGLVNNGIR
jgi:hypothetical protein